MPVFQPNETCIFSTEATHRGTKGSLYLTSHRIIFEYEKGLISKKTYTALNIPLNTITNLNVEGILAKKLVVSVQRGAIGYGLSRIELSIPNAEYWASKIGEVASTAYAAQGATSNMVLKEITKERDIAKIPCGYCGTLFSELDNLCPTCKTPRMR